MPAMSDADRRITQVKEVAIAFLGAKAETWMQRPNRWLTRLTPLEFAESSEAGLRVVLTVLRRYATLEERLLEQEDGRQGHKI